MSFLFVGIESGKVNKFKLSECPWAKMLFRYCHKELLTLVHQSFSEFMFFPGRNSQIDNVPISYHGGIVAWN